MSLKNKEFRWAVAHEGMICFIQNIDLFKNSRGDYGITDVTLTSFFDNSDGSPVVFSSQVAKYVQDYLRETDDFAELGEDPVLFTVPESISMLPNWDNFLEQQGLGRVKLGHLAKFGGLTVKAIDTQIESESQQDIESGTPALKTHTPNLKNPINRFAGDEVDNLLNKIGVDPNEDREINSSLNAGDLSRRYPANGKKDSFKSIIIPKSLPKEPR